MYVVRCLKKVGAKFFSQVKIFVLDLNKNEDSKDTFKGFTFSVKSDNIKYSVRDIVCAVNTF